MTLRRSPPIAVVGLGALFPGSPGKAGFWSDILAGRDNISDVPASHWLIDDYYDPDPTAKDKTYCRRGGFLSPIAFDPMAFGIPPSSLPATDTSQLLGLTVARQTLDDAARNRPAPIDPDRISVILGVGPTSLSVHMNARMQQPIWRKSLREAGLPESLVAQICGRIADHYVPWQEATFPGLLGNVVAGRIANRLGLGGANYVTDAACASSLAAIQSGVHQLFLGEADLVLAGGVDALNDVLMYICFSKTPAFSPSGDCRPFSEAADGTIISEGVGMLALRRLEDAERDGDAIYAVLRGMGSSSDGRANSVYAPRPEGQAKALARAYERAGYSPATVELIEAHGTATRAGDVAEFRGLCSVFRPAAEEARNWCALGSVKSQIGHAKAAAGVAGLIKAILALHHRVLPASIKVDRVNPALNIDASPFYVNSAPRPWVRGPEHPRRASVSSFGFGGSNFHVTLEEYQGERKAPRLRVWPSEFAPLSADCLAELVQACADLADRARKGAPLAALAAAAQETFDARKAFRLVVIAASGEALAARLEEAAAALAAKRFDGFSGDIIYGEGRRPSGKLAYLFPGQGSQYLGMGGDLAMAFDEAGAVWDLAAGLEDFRVDPLHRVVFPPTLLPDQPLPTQEARLTATHNAQPAIAAVSLAQLRLLSKLGLQADAVAGHSFGEVTALAAAGVLSESSLLGVARLRGRLMAQAAEQRPGAMLAVAAGRDRVEAILAATSIDLIVANDNAPDQLVLAGAVAEIARAAECLRQAGVAIHPLPVATAFHSPIVAASCAPFRAALAHVPFGRPRLPIQANATAARYPEDADAMREQLARQLGEPVQFRQMIDALYADGVRYFVEVGPGRVLTGLVDKCLRGRPHRAVALDDKTESGLRGWWRGLARLLADGFDLDLRALGEGLETQAEPVAAPAHAVMISGANYGRPYPPRNSAAGLPPPNPETPPPAAEPRLFERSLQMENLPNAIASPLSQAAAMPPPPAVVAPLPPSPTSGGNLQALAALHQETLAAHRHFQETMAQSHREFLAFAQQAFQQLSAAEPIAANAPAPAVAMAAGALATLSSPIVLQKSAPTPPVVSPPIDPPRVTAETPASPAVDVTALVRRIIADKTGYPPEMLDLDLELEAGLGIDSIKQVEILSALQEAAPGLAPIEPAELSKLRRLRDIVERLSGAFPQQMRVDAPAGASPPAPDFDGAALVRRIIADKTGYPPEMLDLDLELEAGLGIDSIKQVEILSALQEAAPGLAPIEPAELSKLRRLRDIVERLDAARSQTAPVAQPPQEAAAVQRLYRAVPYMAPAAFAGFSIPALRANVVHITNEEPAIADALARQLTDAGVGVRVVDMPPSGAAAVISLAGLASADNPEEALQLHLRALGAARAVARAPAGTGRLFVTVQSAGGHFGLAGDPGPGAWGGGVAGIAKTAALEWPDASVKAIDASNLAEAARLVTRELLEGGPAVEVGFDQFGRRSVVMLREEQHGPAETDPLAGGGVLLVSGGARGVTAPCAAALAKAHGLRLALLGRSDISVWPEGAPESGDVAALTRELAEMARRRGETPDLRTLRERAQSLAAAFEARRFLSELERDGVEARYFSVDVADSAALSRALIPLREDWGPVVAILHGAGVLADRRIEDLDEADFARVFRTKVSGLAAMLEATAGDPLQLLAVFSSVSARYGNAGQAAYAAANETLNKLVAAEKSRRGQSFRARSFNWGPWDGGMVDNSLKALFERSGAALISKAAGAAFFTRELAEPSAPVEIVAAASSAPPARTLRVSLKAGGPEQPYLRDHVFKGRAVLPIVLPLEWVCRLGAAALPTAGPRFGVRDLRVLSGLTFPADLSEPAWVDISIATPSQGEDGMESEIVMSDATGRGRYRAIYMTAPRDWPQPFEPAPGRLDAWPCTVAEAYEEGRLFHGPMFAVIAALEGVSDKGGAAMLRGLSGLDWPQESWLTDPALLDGGFQLGALWMLYMRQRPALPQRIEGYCRYMEPPESEVHCRFRVREVSATRVDFDMFFALPDGAPVAEIRGAEYYAVEL